MSRKNPPNPGQPQQPTQLPPMDFKPPIPDKQLLQGVLIAVRSMPQYGITVMMLYQALTLRAEQILMDFTAQGAMIRARIDGIWENMPPMDRPTADGVLTIFKRLGNLNPADRRSRQQAKIGVSSSGDWIMDFVSQGVPTGERVLIQVSPKKPVLKTLDDLGMRPGLQERLKGLLNSEKFMFLFSAPPQHGLPTLWRVGLEAADRFVRDFHSIEDASLDEPEIINVTSHKFDRAAGETPQTVLKSLLLKQPDVLALPDFVEPETVSLLCSEILLENRCVISRLQAGSAVEALLKLIATYKSESQNIVKVLNGVIGQRLLRRLCEMCRQPFQPSPQLLQKLGIPPGRVQALFQPYFPPPPEQRVDAKGNPIEIPICPRCGGRGYYGRVAVFELLVMTDELRAAVLANPRPEYVVQAARQGGFLTMQEEGILSVATGLTSLQELQRVLAPPK